ncbi:MAG: DUF484 family protein [Gammaproteobacteria bacterium]|nr:DUF484 family protein [Gammaproteobacteria bacterium]
MSPQTRQKTEPELNDNEVARYLEKNPDFLLNRPEILKVMELEHQNEGAVSLIERQVRTLRSEIEQYRVQLDELMTNARDNDILNDRLHKLTLRLMDAASFDEVVIALQDAMLDDFNADAVELHLFSTAEKDPEHHPDLASVEPLLEAETPRCGQLPKEQVQFLFGPQAEYISSTAVIPLGKSDPRLGLLAIGSTDSHRFLPGMSTDYLSRLGKLITKALENVLAPGI